jgi:hypothetical protein
MNTIKTQYMHYRATSAALAVLSTPRNHNDAPMYRGATIAIAPTNENTVAVTVAFCGQKDIFSKKLGRTIAEGRMQAYLTGSRKLKTLVRLVTVTDMNNLKDEVAVAIAGDMSAVGLE